MSRFSPHIIIQFEPMYNFLCVLFVFTNFLYIYINNKYFIIYYYYTKSFTKTHEYLLILLTYLSAMGNFIWNKTPTRQKLLDSLELMPEYGKSNKSALLEIALSEFIQRHAKSHNPQTTLEDNGLKAIPNLYEIIEHPELFDKYYSLLNAQEINYMAAAIKALTDKHIQAKRKFE